MWIQLTIADAAVLLDNGLMVGVLVLTVAQVHMDVLMESTLVVLPVPASADTSGVHPMEAVLESVIWAIPQVLNMIAIPASVMLDLYGRLIHAFLTLTAPISHHQLART